MARVLVCDEPSDARDQLVQALVDAGNEATVVGSGWELLEALSEAPDGYDLVVSDTRMGFPDGLTTATLARASGVRVPFLILTGLASERPRKIAAGVGDVTLLEPPVDTDRVLEAAQVIMARGAPETAPRWVGAASMLGDNDDSDRE